MHLQTKFTFNLLLLLHSNCFSLPFQKTKLPCIDSISTHLIKMHLQTKFNYQQLLLLLQNNPSPFPPKGKSELHQYHKIISYYNASTD